MQRDASREGKDRLRYCRLGDPGAWLELAATGPKVTQCLWRALATATD